jgi:GH24 family phage-related lysozyme (muramidase)
MQEQSLNAMRERALMGNEQELTNLRRVVADPNFDINAPGATNRILSAAPRSGAQTVQALMAAQNQRRLAEGAGLENAVKLTQSFRDLLPTATAENYPAIRAAALAAVPGWAPSWPENYDADAVRALMQKADDKLKEYGVTITATQGGTGAFASPTVLPRGAAPLQGPTFYPAESIPAAPAPTAPGAPAPRAEAPSLGDPGRDMAAAMLRRSEGFRPEPYFDRTAFRTGYGSDQITTADGRVVPVTQGTRVTQEDAERDLARRVPEFERRAAAAVGEERFAALPPNVRAALISVAYNYGTLPGRIRNAVQSGDVDAIAAAVEGLAGDNQGINARRRSEEAAVIRGANAMAPNAAPANAMLAPPDAAVVPRPLSPVEFPGAPRPASLSEADLLKRIRDVQQKEAEALMLADVQRQTAAARIAEEADKARGVAQAQAQVRGNLPPPPAGYRYNQDFTAFEPVPGSPQAQAVTERRGAQVAAANVVTRDIDRILERLDTAVLPVTGMGAPTMAALVGGSPAADVAELRKTIEGNISFNKLNELRQQSPTGGALGNVTDKDLELLKTTLGSLNQNQSPRQFRENLLNLRNAFMEVIHGPNFRDVAPPAREPPAPERLPGRRGAPPTGNRPTLEQFLERARPANPNASTEDLTSYYNRTYGGR